MTAHSMRRNKAIVAALGVRMVPSSSVMLVLLVLLLGCSSKNSSIRSTADAFVLVAPSSLQTTNKRKSLESSLTQLWAKGIKRGTLGKTVGAPSDPPATSSTSQKKKNKNNKNVAATVSPALAQWASTTTTATSTNSSSSTEDDERKVSEATSTAKSGVGSTKLASSFKTSQKTKNSRRVKQSERLQEEQVRQEQVLAVIDALNNLLGNDDDDDDDKQKKPTTTNKKTQLSDILNTIRPLLQLTATPLRQLTAGSESHAYRLAWVGSDDALTHIGTGLHKVPLARMQEVFLTCQGKNRVELLEVIRILGPFPNVKNILQGDSKLATTTTSTEDGSTISQWDIVMDSMVDGTGKAIVAGTVDNIRRVQLQVHFADENAILAAVPPMATTDDDASTSSRVRMDPLEDNGTHALLFVREDDLETKLEKLRVL